MPGPDSVVAPQEAEDTGPFKGEMTVRFDASVTIADLDKVVGILKDEYNDKDRIDQVQVQVNPENGQLDLLVSANRGNVGSGLVQDRYGLRTVA